MESVWDYLSELQSYWVTISVVTLLLLAERTARRWAPIYGPWARKQNRGWLLACLFVLIAAVVLGFSAWRDEHKKNLATVAVVIGQPEAVYNVNGINAITAYIRLKNYGQTIATSTSWEIGVSVLDIEAGSGSFADLGKPQLREGPTVIPPNEFIRRRPQAQWPDDASEKAEIVAAVKKRQKGIFVFGRITYSTLDQAWRSGFCRIYAGHNTAVYKRTASIVLEAYPGHEYILCANPELNYGPRKISQP